MLLNLLDVKAIKIFFDRYQAANISTSMSNRITLTTVLTTGIILAGVWGCEKKAEDTYPSISDYQNLAPGKFIRYRLDSTVYINFGQTESTIKYMAKDVVDAAITDNMGRSGWRIIRYISDTTGTQPWVPSLAYSVFPGRESLDVVERTYRFTKLKIPIVTGYSWKGNSYIDTYSGSSVVRFLDNWDYTYEALDQPFKVWNNKGVDKTLTVNQRNETLGAPADANAYSERTLSTEVYGKGIGLIYKNFLHWEYQPPIGSLPAYRSGYGIRLTMIDHN